jgi:hypothetical protein
MILLIKADHPIDGGFPVIVIRVLPVSFQKLHNPWLRIPAITVDNIAQFPLGSDALLIKGPMACHVDQAVDQHRQSFINDKAITDENLSERPDITRLRGATEPAFGNVE